MSVKYRLISKNFINTSIPITDPVCSLYTAVSCKREIEIKIRSTSASWYFSIGSSVARYLVILTRWQFIVVIYAYLPSRGFQFPIINAHCLRQLLKIKYGIFILIGIIINYMSDHLGHGFMSFNVIIICRSCSG